jgi:uncharacterized protein DUF1579
MATEDSMKKTSMILGAWVVLAAGALAQMEMPKPAPELKKLDTFAGTWTLDGDMKPGPMGPGGKMSGQEKCAWMDGGFYLVCNSSFKSPLGSATGTSYFGYSNEDKAYTYREFNSMGEFTDARGKADGDVWTWNSEDKVGGQMMKGRYVVKVTSPSAYDFKFDMSQDGNTWTPVMAGKSAKGK